MTLLKIIIVILCWEAIKWAFDRIWYFQKDKVTIRVSGSDLKVTHKKAEQTKERG